MNSERPTTKDDPRESWLALELYSVLRQYRELGTECDDVDIDALLAIAAHTRHTFRGQCIDTLAGDVCVDTVRRKVIQLCRAAASAPRDSDDFTGLGTGNFRVDERIGWGGMGVVYKGFQYGPDREVAIKFVLPERSLVASEALRARFQDEIRRLGRLKHANIVDIYDDGIAELPSGQRVPWFAMALADGLLVDLLDVQAPSLDRTRQVIPLFREVCDAIAHAHSRGVFHRDLKPANVLAQREDDPPRLIPKVCDFGLAVLAEQSGSAATLGQSGTPGFRSPKLLRGEEVSGIGADLFSLGMLFYVLLAGTPTFFADLQRVGNDGDGLKDNPLKEADIVDQALASLVLPDQVAAASRRKELEAIIKCALYGRYDTVRHLITDIEAYLRGTPISPFSHKVGYCVRRWVDRQRHGVRAAIGAVVFSLALAVSGVGIHRAWVHSDHYQLRSALASAPTVVSSARPRELVALVSILFAAGRSDEASYIATSQSVPELRIQLLSACSLAHFRLSQYDAAAEMAEEALRVYNSTEPLATSLMTAYEVIRPLVLLGRADEAMVVAQRAATSTSELIDAMLFIADTAAVADDPVTTTLVLGLARATANQLPTAEERFNAANPWDSLGYDQREAMLAIASAHARQGRADSARELLTTLPSPHNASASVVARAPLRISSLLAQAGAFEDAIAVARSIEHAPSRFAAFAAISRAAASAGTMTAELGQEGLEAWRLVGQYQAGAASVIDRVGNLIALGAKDDAKELLSQLLRHEVQEPNSVRKASRLIDMVAGKQLLEDHEGARALVRLAISAAQSETDINSAINLGPDLAVRLAELGYPSEARAMLAAVEFPDEYPEIKNISVRDVAEALIRTGAISDAAELVDRIGPGHHQPIALSLVAAALAETGHCRAARDTADLAVASLRYSTDDIVDSFVCLRVALVLMRCGRLYQAANRIETCASPADQLAGYNALLKHYYSAQVPSFAATYSDILDFILEDR